MQIGYDVNKTYKYIYENINCLTRDIKKSELRFIL
mgnify:CR=1 FL=1|jgi:hypothetical protein